jgi:predicted deacylase
LQIPSSSATLRHHAVILTSEVIDRADYLIDLHAGDGNEVLRPFVYMPVTGETELDEASKGLAMAFVLDHIVVDKAPRDCCAARQSRRAVGDDQSRITVTP